MNNQREFVETDQLYWEKTFLTIFSESVNKGKFVTKIFFPDNV